MLESGPAAGVVGTKALCDSINVPNAIAFDMGGTTAKAGVIYEGNVLMTGSALIGGYATGLPVQMPMIDIQEVGTGGGSIARVEVGNALRVGPELAGAAPGPVCYGLGGTEPTITDANLILGRLGADRFLGGEMKLDLDVSEEGTAPTGSRRRSASIRSKPPKASCASPPPRWRTSCAGSPPSAASTPPTSRSSPMAAQARCTLPRWRANFPSASSSFRARRGTSRPTACWSRTCAVTSSTPGSSRLADASFSEMEEIFADMERQGRDTVGRGQTLTGVEVRRSADMRYVGQEHAVTVELPIDLFTAQDRDGIKARFDAVHQTRYGFSVAEREGRDREPARRGDRRDAKAAVRACRQGWRGARRRGVPRQAPGVFRQYGGFVETPTYDRPALKAGNKIAGPALIEEHASTTVVQPGDQVVVDAFGDLVITVRRG